ncbi:hypothetical protein N7532_006366 [Penicillium argentinense]|uniref:Uncharacterized protein n=1 Tax=Penicillium argentinense TaxID=1131581 RepID=A0A9W9FFN8_9EURO|nr:uncharacterized protein N7532_006366 [Penicillium argentinense]KAJ5099365.1 hypothetical protein N7532_006366 [Penicillium argentinense]
MHLNFFSMCCVRSRLGSIAVQMLIAKWCRGGRKRLRGWTPPANLRLHSCHRFDRLPILFPTASLSPIRRTTAKMKPVVSALNAWSCVVISLFAIVILSVLGSLFGSNNHAYTGTEGEPEDGAAVAASIYTAVIIYAGFFVFCGFQAYLHLRGSRGGAISLH